MKAGGVFVCVLACLCVRLFVCLCVCLFVCLFVCFFVCLLCLLCLLVRLSGGTRRKRERNRIEKRKVFVLFARCFCRLLGCFLLLGYYYVLELFECFNWFACVYSFVRMLQLVYTFLRQLFESFS